MTTFLEGYFRNIVSGAGINGGTATVKKHSDGSTVDSVATAGAGADQGNYEFTEAEILAGSGGSVRYPGQIYIEEVLSGTTRVRSSKTNGQLGPIRPNDITRVIKALGQGVVDGFGTNFAATAAGTDMIVDIAAGFAYGAGQTYYNVSADEVTITAAHATLPRIDNIVIRFYPVDAASEHDVGRVDVLAVAGTPDAAPVAPALTQSTTTFWEERICTVAVGAAVTTISTGNLTDTRRYVQTDIPTGTDGQYLKLVGGKPTWDTFTTADVTDFEEAVEDLIGANVVAGAGISVSYDDPGTGQTTITATGGGTATITVQEGDSTVDAAASTLDFDASDFNVTSSPAGEANISLAYGTSAGTPAEGNHTHDDLSHPSSPRNTEYRNYVTAGTAAITSTTGQEAISFDLTLDSTKTYDCMLTGGIQGIAPSGGSWQAGAKIGSTAEFGAGEGTESGEKFLGVSAVAGVTGITTLRCAVMVKKVGGSGNGSYLSGNLSAMCLPRHVE